MLARMILLRPCVAPRSPGVQLSPESRAGGMVAMSGAILLIVAMLPVLAGTGSPVSATGPAPLPAPAPVVVESR